MRIVELVNTLEVGGTERLVADLSIMLQSMGHELTVVCLRGKGPLARSLEDSGIEIFALNKPEGPDLRTLWRLRTFLKKNHIQVVHTHNPLVHHYGAAAGRLAGVPAIVSTIHGLGNLAERPGAKERLYSLACRLSSRVIAVCPMAYRSFLAGGIIPAAKLVAVNNGIRLEPFLRVEPRPGDRQFVFGIVGRLVPVKDHRSLLEAFALVVQKHPQCRLEILGDGPLSGELQAHAAKLGIAERVAFRGYSADVAGFLTRVDVAILCSVSEGLPLGILEAMAAAKPIVGTAVGGMQDLIDGGQCGWLSPPRQVEALARNMLRACDADPNELAEMGARARQHVIEHYSLTTMAQAHEKLFGALVN